MGGNKSDKSLRKLKFQTLDDLMTDAQSLANADILTRGGWTAAQVFSHVAIAINASVEGFGLTMPLPMRIFGRLMRNRMIKKGIPAGIKIPEHAKKLFVPPSDITLDQAMAQLTSAVNAAKQKGMHAPSPIFGKLTHDQWVQFHCRHAEMHFSHLAPA